MSLVGRGLDGVVKEAGGRLSLGSAVGVSIQMLAALRGLHTVGYLHRDIKPGNSTIGRPESNEIRLLYLIDFGMARKYTKDDVREPTPPARCHQLPRKPTLRCDQRSSRTRIQPQGRHRIVVLLHDRALQRRTSMVQRGGDESDWDAKVKRQKKQPEAVRRQAIADLLSGCPSEFGQVLKYIDDMKYTDKPDYDWIIATLRSSLSNAGVQEFPYDWETGKRNAAPGAGGGGGGGGGDSYFN
ncbi:hypothetical protein niasHT_038182 [Heterodera trifolii]|uniref:Protein kinase domain-containing protein n=1 Tax=Heterodera trifolii TaxID=157864 RepID=A0ABD2IJN5_9BILA